MPRDPLAVGLQTWRRRLAGVLPRPIMDAPHVRRGLLQHPRHKPLETGRVHAAFDALIQQTPGAVGNRPTALVALARAAGRPLRLPAAACPGGTQRAPRRNTGFILAPAQALTPFDRAQHRGPLGVAPGVAPRGGAPTPSAPAATQSPRCAVTSAHPGGGWRARRTRARSASGCGQRSTRRSHRPPPAVQPQAAPPHVSLAEGAAVVGARREGGSSHSPGRAAARPAARHRDRRSGGPSARPAPPMGTWCPRRALHPVVRRTKRPSSLREACCTLACQAWTVAALTCMLIRTGLMLDSRVLHTP